MKRLVLLIGIIGFAMGIRAQERMIRPESVEQRRVRIGAIPPDPFKTDAIRVTERAGMPLRLITADQRIREVRRINEFGKPEYFTTLNRNAAKTIATDKVWAEGENPYKLSGNGIVVGIWDGGVLRSSHVEFEERAIVIDEGAEVVGHATHVSGTIGAKGIDDRATGMAREVVMEGYDWNSDIQEMDAAAGEGLLLSNHSYGYINGWDYNQDESRWEWWGELNVSEQEDYLFGFYHREARDYDRLAHKHPYYLIVKSAGNDRGEGPSPGAEHYVWKNGDWVSSTDSREKDGGSDGFDSMGPAGNAKNILSVGSIKDLPLGFTDAENVRLSGFSAFGPTDDGRIKPDLVANGDGLLSSYSGSDTDYNSSSGTSMSAPNATGSLALIQEHHFDLYNTYLTSAALKGLALHTADDALSPGPDYRTGWGVMNTLNAIELISDDSYDRVMEDSIMEGEEKSTWLYSDGSKPIRVSICWTDPAGVIPDPALDPVQRILLNDLDVRLIRDVDGHEFMPFVLDPLHPANQATRGDNRVDNMEQVYIEAPQKGFYELLVTHKDELLNGKQHFAKIVSGLTDEYFASGISELNDNNGEFVLTSAPEYVADMSAGWVIAPENAQPIRLYFDFFSTEMLNDTLVIHDGQDASAPVIAVLSGDQDIEDLDFYSSGAKLFVTFTSDGQMQSKGFRAVYCTTAPDETPQIQGELFPCWQSREQYVAFGASGVDYNWIPPADWSIDSVMNDGIILNTGSGSGTLKATAVNRCGTGSEASLILSPLDSVPALESYMADTIPCANSASFIEVDSLPGAHYDWDLPIDWLGSGMTNRLDYIPGYESGTVRVIAINSCGNGDTIHIPVSVKNIPGEDLIRTTRDKPCALSEQQFFVAATEGHSYSWEVSDDWSIVGEPDNDTVTILVGSESSFLFVNNTNKCGTRKSNKLFLTSAAPDDPQLHLSSSDYEGYSKLTVINAQLFTGFQWYLNDSEILSTAARMSEYVAYLPGIYSVAVSNRDGCQKKQSIDKGYEILQINQVYSVYQGPGGHIVALNSTSGLATLNIMDYKGNILNISTITPGYNEIPWDKEGVFIISVSGPEHQLSTRIFTHQ